MATFTVPDPSDLAARSDEQLDDLYAWLLGQHREAIGLNRTVFHRGIMAILAEWSHPLDAWLATR